MNDSRRCVQVSLGIYSKCRKCVVVVEDQVDVSDHYRYYVGSCFGWLSGNRSCLPRGNGHINLV